MKAITIKNPWAHLIVKGIKDIENRSWPTKYRGKVLIHSSQKIDHRFRAMNIMFTPEQWEVLPEIEQRKAVCGIYNSSAIIGEVDIVDCIRNSNSIWAIPNDWHWVLANAKMYENPIQNIKGKLSFWEYTSQQKPSNK